MCHQKIEGGGYDQFFTIVRPDGLGRNLAQELYGFLAFTFGLTHVDIEGIGEVTERDHGIPVFVTEECQERIELLLGNRVLQLKIPVAGRLFLPPETDRARGKVQLSLAVGHD